MAGDVARVTISGHGLTQLEHIGRDLKPQYKAVLSNNATDENGVAYGPALHFNPRYRGQYLVMDREHLVQGLVHSFHEHLQTHLISDNLVVNALKAACVREVAHYQSFTGEMRPPTEKDGEPRPAHPGHWADISRKLAGAYKIKVQDEDVELRPYT